MPLSVLCRFTRWRTLFFIFMIQAIALPLKPLDVVSVRRLLEQQLDGVAQEAQRRLQAQTSDWQDQPRWTIRKRGAWVRDVMTAHAVYQYQDDGTKAHPIYPRNRQYLRFKPRGENSFVFARRVHHPGTKAQHFTETVAKSLARDMDQLFKVNG